MKTAILVDAAFFIVCYPKLYRKGDSPETVADNLHKMCLEHIKDSNQSRELYRIFVYDCPPLEKKAHNPISGKAVDLSKSDTAIFRKTFHLALKKKRLVALRMGYLNEDHAAWQLRASVLKDVLLNKKTHADLVEKDVFYYAKQKSVDMKIGLDIASLSYKKQVDQIILVSGDSDFVPAAKLARREGIDFILDPLWQPIRQDLFEHIDGLHTVANRKPRKSKTSPSTKRGQAKQDKPGKKR